MNSYYLVGIHVKDREKKAQEIQKVLTKHGCSIRTRIGLSADGCTSTGLIIVQLSSEADQKKLMDMLKKIDVEARKITF